MPYTLAELNQLDQDAFVVALGAVFEDTPAIAHHVWQDRPFRDVNHLHQVMVDRVKAMHPDHQLALIQAHPDLGSKTSMAEASVTEQAGAGLDRLSPQDYQRFHALNQAYKTKFGFPFIIAVKQQTQASILEAFEQRFTHTPDAERAQALREIFQIAYFRLLTLVT